MIGGGYRARSRSWAAGFALLAAVFRLGTPDRLSAQQSPPEPRRLVGETVVSLAYTTDGPVDRSEVARLVSIKPGRPLTEEV
ncbi:MAG TPA: hypothetical protein VK392_01540, partial [Thermoanaerobaculia bacterium]|nr:hypothetical protein [Thermoanaerobaculia bacterium]